MKSLKTKLFLIFISFSFIVGGMVGGIIFFRFSGYIDTTIKGKLDDATEFILHTLPVNSFAEYAEAMKRNDPWILEYKETMRHYAKDTGLAFLYLVTREGDRVPTIEFSNSTEGERIVYWEAPAPEALSALENKRAYLSKPYTDEFGTFISFYKPWETSDGVPVVVGVDYELSYVNSVRQVAGFSFVISFLIGLALAAAGSFFISTNLARPMLSLNRELERLADVDADLTLRVQSRSGDEIGRMAESFNAFVAKLQQLMIEVKHAIENTDSIKLSITSSTEETSSAIEEISATMESIRTQISVLDQNINGNAEAIKEVIQNMVDVDQQIVSQSAMVEQSSAAITQMIASLNNVNNVAQNKKEATLALSSVAAAGKARIIETAEAFKIVVQYIEQIQEMASAINSIAAQTNLLSMNAAIEAAHAGEAGKGFAVVAEEIRKLADSAGKSSQSISQLIKNITASVLDTEKKVFSSSEAFEQITLEVKDTINAFSEIESSVSELNSGGKQILDSTNRINEVTVFIKNGSKDIKSGTEKMLASSGEIKRISETVSSGMNESVTGAREIVSSMQLMVSLTHELSSIVERLKNDFDQFKTE